MRRSCDGDRESEAVVRGDHELGQLVDVGGLARAMTSYGPVRQAGSDTPGRSCSAAATAAALPTLVWIKMYAAITGTRRTFPSHSTPTTNKETVQSKSRPGVVVGSLPRQVRNQDEN